MGRLQSKILFMLVLYGAGFATAMYLMAPADRSETGQSQAASEKARVTDQQQVREQLLAASCKLRVGMDKLVSFAEEKTALVAGFLQQKWSERQAADG